MDPSRATSDHTILAVAQLALYEARVGDGVQCSMHLALLANSLCRRGGLSMLGLEGLLARIVFWMDYTASILIETNNRLNDPTLAQ